MKIYEKVIDGITVRKPKNEIVLVKGGRQIINPKEELLLEDGWMLYTPPAYIPKEFGPEEILENKRKEILGLIEEYDKSDKVNNCHIFIDGQTASYWAGKAERSSLVVAVKGYMDQGRNVYRLDLRDAGFHVSVDCHRLLEMLSELEAYAIDCYNKTTDHIFNVRRLATVEELEAYDYREGYPGMLTFNI